MATLTSTSTAVELYDVSAHSENARYIGQAHNDTGNSSSPESSDAVLEASRLADSAVPDGGYGWVVVSGCALMAFWFIGTSYSWGVTQAALVDKGVSSPAILSYVGSLSICSLSIMAILNARVIQTIGVRNTGLLGMSLLGGAEILSSFAMNSVPGLFMTAGVMLGLGISLLFMTVSVTPAQYFSRKRGLANGIVFAGGGLGGAITSYTLDALIQQMGASWAYRVLGLTTLVTGLPAAWFIKERAPVKTAGLIEWRLFKDTSFLIIFASGIVATFPLLVPPFFLPLYSQSIGLSSSTGAGLLAGFNFSSAVGRILCGFLCDKFGALNTLLLSLSLNSVCMLAIWPASTTLGPLATFVVLSGAASGGYFSTMPTVVGNVFGSQRVSVAMAMIVTGWAGGYLMGAPIAGYILEAYGGTDKGFEAYRPAIFYAGSMALGATVLVAVARFRMQRSLMAKL